MRIGFQLPNRLCENQKTRSNLWFNIFEACTHIQNTYYIVQHNIMVE
jgi:phage anti-repressor protein